MAMGNGKGSLTKTTSLKKGLNADRAKFPDSSMGLKGESVDARAVRKEPAPTPKSLGPRKTGM